MTTSTSILKATNHGTRVLSATEAPDALLWNSLVDAASCPDVYYRPGYVAAYQAIGHGKAVAILVETEDLRAIFPLLLRPLNTLPFAHDEKGFDAATPYGYGGLLLLDGARDVDEQQRRRLLQGLRGWCRENGVITAHIRLHPVLRQEEWFRGTLGEDFALILLGPTTALDLERWNPSTGSIASMKKGRRSDLSFARRSLHLSWASDGRVLQEDLRLFRDLYEQRMTELAAGEYYHFDVDYYRSLAEGLGVRFDVAIAWLGERPVGAALFMTDRIMSHYHLSASNEEGRANKATTLILNGAAERARHLGCSRLHLGGGARGEDKLFAFKESFGGDIYRYSCLSLICDSGCYRRLAEKRMVSSELPPARPNFFPEYRA